MTSHPQSKDVDGQNDGKTEAPKTAGQDPLTPMLERMIKYRLAGRTQSEAYQSASPGYRSKKSREQTASKLFNREDVKNRLAYLAVTYQKPVENGENQADDQAEIKPKSSPAGQKHKQPVDSEPLSRELVRAMLVRALTTENPNSATVSAISAAQRFLDSETPADSRPGPETIADYLAAGAPANKGEIPAIVRALCKAYQVTREEFACLAHLSMDAETGDRSAIMRQSDEIPPKSADEMSSNNNDLGL